MTERSVKMSRTSLTHSFLCVCPALLGQTKAAQMKKCPQATLSKLLFRILYYSTCVFPKPGCSKPAAPVKDKQFNYSNKIKAEMALRQNLGRLDQK